MAAGQLAPPGTRWGPCRKGTCSHPDCKVSYRQAETKCKYCKEPIGWERRYYMVKFPGDPYEGAPVWTLPVHASCHEDAVGGKGGKQGGKTRENPGKEKEDA